ncbi:MAG: FKBP-type peptidyl-prolyl cis-trans isomerase [Myxococcaceae bacterium]|nr:FKBP-type peptidyl-prolyl cis-trans isomerase [Myxococcaceae bacterium]
MKRLAWVCVLALCAPACVQQKQSGGKDAAAAANPQTEDQKTLYALGLSLGRSISTFNLSADELAYVEAGMEAQVTGKTPAVKLEEYGPKLQTLARARTEARAAKEKEKGKAALEAAAKEPNAQKFPSGLVYVPIKEGTGPSPTQADTVKVNYRGTLVSGEEFDSSYKRNQPATFPLRGVIPCWTEGLQKMKVGGKAKLVCPSSIAYGDRGAPPNIPGGATLIFEVELLDILTPPAPATPAAPQPAAQSPKK